MNSIEKHCFNQKWATSRFWDVYPGKPPLCHQTIRKRSLSYCNLRREYMALLGSLMLVALEGVVALITIALRQFSPLLVAQRECIEAKSSPTNHRFLLSQIESCFQLVLPIRGERCRHLDSVQGGADCRLLRFCRPVCDLWLLCRGAHCPDK